MNTYPLTLYYDGACPICSLEMDHLRERSTDGRLVFVDIDAPGFDAAAVGVAQRDLMAEIHGRTADGRLLRGLPVLRHAYAAAGLGAWLATSGWPLLRPLADIGYRLFARHRQALSRAARPLIDGLRARRSARRMQACRSGRCDLTGEGS
jgi:predicted DCC family thiol-disulfide oxidoreductase YuxK